MDFSVIFEDIWAKTGLLPIEVVWPPEFGIEKLIAESGANVEFLRSAIQRTRYVSAKHLDI